MVQTLERMFWCRDCNDVWLQRKPEDEIVRTEASKAKVIDAKPEEKP